MSSRIWFAFVFAACAPDSLPVHGASWLSGARVGNAVDPLLTEAWRAESDQASASFGFSVSSAGDVNGDGYGDAVVGAYLYDNGETDEGRVYLYLGSVSGLESTAAWTAQSNQANAQFGNSVSSAGDVNGDGYGDVVVGAWGFSNGQNGEGQAFLYLGSPTGLETTAAWTADLDQPAAHFGRSVSSAGDVNGDGYDDVIVGAESYSNGEFDEGAAFLYLGSATGLETTATWTAESNQITANLGWSVSSAGDVNGDGYGDVVVGALHYDNGETNEGSAFLYLGSATGLETNFAWTAESDQNDARFGQPVSSAGDVNGDGYGDVVVGAVNYSSKEVSEGRAYVYLGSATGLATTAAWTAESDENFAIFGQSVSSAGDVNGDGFGDVAVGASGYSNGQMAEGRAYLYLGSATGLGTTAAWTAESDQKDASFGVSLSSAGDVNGDGYGDLVVGADGFGNVETDEGRAYLYVGGCPDGANLPFEDSDADVITDACDLCVGFDDLLDDDLDGIPTDCDLCPYVHNARQEDTDGDGVGDACVPLTLAVHAVSIANGLSVEVDGAFPGKQVSVVLATGPIEVGPCSEIRAGLCLDVGEDGRRWNVAADASGHAALVVALPPGSVVGTAVTVQAGAARGTGGVKSDPVETVVTP